MNLNDRVALIIGRAVIRAEELVVRLEEQETELQAVRAELNKLKKDKGGK